MSSRAIILLAPLVLLLAACSGHKKNFAPDLSDDFVRAERLEEPPAEVRIVEVPKPLPLPGQLKKLPEENTDTTEGRMPSTSEVREKAVWSPEQGNYLNAIQVYPFVEGALYQLYASPGHVTDIALEPGEQLVSVSAGDTVRWVIGDTVSGAGEGAQVHLLIKPVQKELETNLVITTDRRSYYLDLKSFEETYMTAMRWTYPQTEIRALTRLNERSRNSAVIDKGLQLEDLDFSYSIQGDEPDWRPLRAFDDGRKIYIEFPATIDRREAPPLFVLGRKDEVELVNYRMRGNYYIVDRLFARAELRLGTDPQTRVQIVHHRRRRQ
ncbi:P-type conjugative transfer protein TrbG [Emcibacter nanhaiensis]|uniref:P-type conjugative transfer protein TrbG n=1 Tax=Emcibacter nanhaiensis TaxID=1505037 RepID=A0A501PH75_9PROT|nr:P-type conjugative transfer protein TrbG [Emcibacter nanhaiensis]TPD59304.1 P-type conjugative transfer protein TrbG [Emcibacter nanhaiensis]